MTRHLQTRQNNCLQTCLASIFDVEIEEAPDIWRMPGAPRAKKITSASWGALQRWTAKHGKTLLRVDARNRSQVKRLESSGEYYIACGPAGNGGLHAVVMYGGQFVHDPAGVGPVGPVIDYIALEDRKSLDWGVIILLFVLLALVGGIVEAISGL